ncbi:D-xylose 1-dehydrogenase Gfo6 [Halobaculum sp. D14]|uniref:D-xylose 1-dehydrogenase Gfo6 n=1 Tax=unclassified Halobaculum TaxID=2640896 RepID=UPI003EC030C8
MSLSEYVDEFERRDWQTTTDGTVRFALIGLGWWTVEEAIPAIAESDHCETTTLVTSSTAKGEEVAADVDTVTDVVTYDEFHDGAAADAYDAVYICTPNAYHLDFARTAAELGKDVLTEKPMEATVERAAEMVAVCDANDVTLAVGYRMQTEPIVRRVRELVQSGAIGEPCHVHGANTQRLLDIFDDPDQWRLDRDRSGYGTSVMDLGIYPINTARFILDADPVAAQATMRSEHEAFSDVPDEHAAFTLEFDDGVLAACTASQNAHTTTHLEITGTEGRVRIEPAFHLDTELTVTLGDTTLDFDTPKVNQMTEVFDYFGHAVVTDADVGLDGEHGLVDMETIAAIHRSADTGGRVTIE